MPKNCTENYHDCLDEVCGLIGFYGTLFQMSSSYIQSSWFSILEASSAIVAAFFGFFVATTKELQVHPMKIIMYLAFVESTF